MKNILFQWVSLYCIPPVWMARAFYSIARNKTLFVVFPLNLLIALAWWIQDIWARAAHAPSWIDREVEARIAERPSRKRWSLTVNTHPPTP
jgi:hypothetical protein